MAQDLAREFVADLYRRERSGLTRNVARIAGESHAEDLVHDAFVAYITKSPWATKPGAWVATVARNRALNELRRPRLVSITTSDSDGNTIDLTDRLAATAALDPIEAEREAVREVVAAALSALPERALVALRMKFFEGADYEAIADMLGVRVAQAHVIVHRALRRLGRELVHRMAEAHGASGCAPALLRMAGLGGGDESHDGPCPTCRPAWDEIVALRIGGWMPLPLVAFKNKVRGALESIAGAFRGTLAAEPVSWAANAVVALGVAATSFAPGATAPPTSDVATTRVTAPRVADAGAPVVAPAAERQAGAPDVSAPGSSGAGGGKAPRKNTTYSPVRGGHVAPPSSEDDDMHVQHDEVGGVVVCTDVTTGCGSGPGTP